MIKLTYFFPFLILRIKPRVLCMLGECSTTELLPTFIAGIFFWGGMCTGFRGMVGCMPTYACAELQADIRHLTFYTLFLETVSHRTCILLF